MLALLTLTGPEKRKHPRISVQIPAIYHSTSMTVDVYVRNLSPAGAFLSGAGADLAGTPAEICLSLPNQAAPVRIRGRVVWSQGGKPHSGMGFVFTEVSRENRLALANFILARYCSS